MRRRRESSLFREVETLKVLGSYEAEQYVVGALINFPLKTKRYIDEFAIDRNWFYYPPWRNLFTVISDLCNEGVTPDFVTVIESVRDHKMEVICTTEHIQKSTHECVTFAHVPHHVGILKKKYLLRQYAEFLIEEARTLQIEESIDPVELISSAKLKLEHINLDDPNGVDMSVEIANMTRRYKAARQTGAVGIPSRWPQITAKTTGYWRGKLSVVGSRPKKGKTFWGTNEVADKCMDGIGCGFVSLEMTEYEIHERMAADYMGIDLIKYRKGRASDEEITKLTDRIRHQMEHFPLHVSEGGKTIEQICAWILDRADEIPFVCLDYVQRITPGENDPRTERECYARWSTMLTNLAHRANVHIMALCQLNRDAEIDMQGKRRLPTARNLKGSGQFEQDAHQVILIARSEELVGEEERNDLQPTIVRIGYNRVGNTGDIPMIFAKCRNRFEPDLTGEAF
jgi:replicative DNA helicase